MQFFSLFLLLLLLLSPSAALSSEIDSITPRKLTLEDSLESLNSIINTRLRTGVAKANEVNHIFTTPKKEDYCNEEVLYEELRKAIFNSMTSSLGLKGYSLDTQLQELLENKSHSLPLEDSIYSDISYIEGFSLNLKELSDVVNVQGHFIGLDKIGHFFAEGWKYFEMTSQDGKTLQEAMAWGTEMEEGLFGYTTTGIFSYADLVANYNGWRFWNSVLSGGTDPLKGVVANFFDTPYVGCGIRILDSIRSRSLVYSWHIKKKFDLRDYLDGMWDEGNNCVSFKDTDIEEKVFARIKERAPGFSCPAVKAECIAAKVKYDLYAKELLHPSCLAATAEQN